jgi:hypothetical protein
VDKKKLFVLHPDSTSLNSYESKSGSDFGKIPDPTQNIYSPSILYEFEDVFMVFKNKLVKEN